MAHSTYNGPGMYRIRVAGRVDKHWSERLGGLQAEGEAEGSQIITVLTGYLADQAALYGVLNTLYDYRYPLLNVEYLGPAVECPPDGEDANAR